MNKDRLLEKFDRFEVGNEEKPKLIEIRNKNGQILQGIFGVHSFFIPLNTNFSEFGDPDIMEMVTNNVAAVKTNMEERVTKQAFKALGLIENGQISNLFGHLKSFGSTTGIHIFSKHTDEPEEFLEHVNEVFKSLDITYTIS